MAISKTAVVILAATTSTAGTTTKASPSVTGGSVDVRSYYGGELTFKITNGTAPGSACVVVFQASHDGTNWYDYQLVTGTVTTSDVVSGSILLDRGVMYVRAIAYGNTTNNVTVEAHLQAITGV
jgi:hypothetical protein